MFGEIRCVDDDDDGGGGGGVVVAEEEETNSSLLLKPFRSKKRFRVCDDSRFSFEAATSP